MRFSPILLSLFVVSAVASPKGDGKSRGERARNGTSINFQCAEIEGLTRLTALANNDTALQEIAARRKFTDEQVQAFKTKAQNATAKLQELQSNATLQEQCPAILAQRKVRAECSRMKKLQRISQLAGNQTALSNLKAEKDLSDDDINKITLRAQNATAKLQELTSNQTLVTLCNDLAAQQNSDAAAAGSQKAAASSEGGITASPVGTGLFVSLLAAAMAVMV